MLHYLTMKTCSKCGNKKRPNQFYVKDGRTGKLHAQCKGCYQLHRQTYYSAHYRKYREDYLKRARLRREKLKAEFRKKMTDYLSDKTCVTCGESDIRVLELDHINPAKKSFTVSQAVKLERNWDEVISELEKCQILCANCHRRRTAQQYYWHKAN